MNLVIHAHTFKNEPLPQVIVGNFDVTGGSIGRAPTNTLTLPDPDRHIPRSHAQIICNDGDFLIRNVSSANPIAVDGRVVLPGEVVSLGHCVEILMGSYALQAKRITATLTTGRATSNRDAEPEFAAPPSSATPSQIAAFSELVREHGVAPTIDEWPSIIEPAEAGLRPVQEVPTSWFKFGAKPDAQVAPAVVPAQFQATGILRPVQHMAETTMPAVRVPSPREIPFAVTPPTPMPPIPGAATASDLLAHRLGLLRLPSHHQISRCLSSAIKTLRRQQGRQVLPSCGPLFAPVPKRLWICPKGLIPRPCTCWDRFCTTPWTGL
jgi:predicted component of type VI protein secretion system